MVILTNLSKKVLSKSKHFMHLQIFVDSIPTLLMLDFFFVVHIPIFFQMKLTSILQFWRVNSAFMVIFELYELFYL